MRIVYHHRTRGTDAQKLHILAIVRSLKVLGCEVEIIGPTDLQQEKPPESEAELAWWQKVVRRFTILNIVLQLAYNFVGLLLLISHLRKKTDLIYERYALFNFSGILAAKLFNIPLILEVNSPLAMEQYQEKEILLPSFALWAERTICNAADKVLVVSTPLKRIMEANGVDSERLEVMLNGVERIEKNSPSETLRDKLGLRGHVVVGCHGWFRAWHGVDLLIEAFEEARRILGSGKLLLIGDGPALKKLREAKEIQDLANDVLFVGAVSHEVVGQYLSLFDIAVQPAATQYACPMKILEYMSFGKAIVVPKQENIIELVGDGPQAMYFRPGDVAELTAVLVRLMQDDCLRHDLGANAQEAVRQRGLFWINNARRILEIATTLSAQS